MLKDPVTDFVYPESWVERCNDRDALRLVEEGLAVLTSSGDVLRRGFTTGTTAAAACKAAVLSLERDLSSVAITTPSGITITVPVTGANGVAIARKYSGDYPSDLTAGARFEAKAVIGGEGVELTAGKGIGRFARNTDRYKIGDPAISPTAMACILYSAGEAMFQIGAKGVRIELQILEGEEIAPRTLNSKMGVEGGISVLGTTGFVEPWDDHLEESNLERISRADKIVLTTGRNGLRLSRLMFPDHEAILVGIRMARAVDAAKGEVILCGLPALILKFIDPDVLEGTGLATIEELRSSDKWSETLDKALKRSKRERPGLRVVILDREGRVLGDSQ